MVGLWFSLPLIPFSLGLVHYKPIPRLESVAQTFSLPYRGLPVRWAKDKFPCSNDFERLPTKSRRYDRLKVCATPKSQNRSFEKSEMHPLESSQRTLVTGSKPHILTWMNAVWSVLLLVALSFGSIFSASAQTTAAEKQQFEFMKAQADRGDALAQLTLGNYYASGTGVNRDLAKAAKWHRKAAEQGLPRAQFRVAFEYSNGVGVKLDLIEGVKWLRRAAEQGLADAQVELGKCYSTGEGIGENPVAAATWFRKAAEQNFPAAQYALGNCYFEGYGVTKDIPEGVLWTRKAAEQGLPEAENSFGMCYAKGKGVPQDYLEAYKWFNLAAAQGGEHNTEAHINLSMAERAMTPEQIAQGQKLARDFKPHSADSSPTGLKHTITPSGPPNSKAAGFLTVKADDETYDVYLDAAFVGNSPAKLKLDPGLHVIEVKKQGFKDFRKEIRVTDGSEQTLRAVLDKQ
jgi:TPR repeat protein